MQCLRELRDNSDEVFTSALQLANENGTESEFPTRRRRKVSRRLDAAASTETVTSIKDEVKHEMTDVVDTAQHCQNSTTDLVLTPDSCMNLLVS